MMKTIKRTLAALLALTALAGCRNAEQEVPDTGSLRTVRFHAGTADTRTAFTEAVDGVYQTLWTDNDTDILLSLNYGKAVATAVTRSADGSTASFDASFDVSATTSPYTFYAVSPASAARAISPSRNAWSVYIAAGQTPSALSVDEAAQLLVAKSAASATLPEEVDLHFAHLTAYGRVTLNNLELGEAVVRKVELVFSTPVVGEFYWGEDGTLTSNGASHTITLDTDASGDLWFACAPVDVSGATLALSVFTDQGTLTKEITFPEGRQFTSGKVARFSVDMAGVTFQKDGSFVLVSDASQLQLGDQILIVNAAGTYALGKQVTGGTAHRDQASVRVENGQISDPGQATFLTLGTGSVSGTWTLEADAKYLAAASSKNVLTESASVSKYSSWEIQVSDGKAVVHAQQGSSTYIRYNASATRFSCYPSATNQGDIAIYRRGSGPSVEDPVTESAEYGSYVTGALRTYVQGSDQIVRSYDADGKLVFTIVDAAEKEQLVISGFDPTLAKGDAAVVSVAWKKGKQTLLKERTFNLQVVKEDGSKVWLGDGSGQGFILKK